MPKNNSATRKAWRKSLADTRVMFWTEFDKRNPGGYMPRAEIADALDPHLALRSPRP